MAREVEGTAPHAVIEIGEHKAIGYHAVARAS